MNYLSRFKMMRNFIPIPGPRHLYFSSFQRRLNSFNDWPPGLKQTKEEMAKAGFYYGGYSDHVSSIW